MYIIDTNLTTTAISMSNENSNYPVANAIHKRPKKVAKSTTTSSLMIFRGGGTDLFLFRALATSGNLDITDVTAVTKVSGTTLSVTANNKIEDSGNGLNVFSPGDDIVVTGFTTDANNGKFTIDTVDAGGAFVTLTTTPLTIEGAGDSVDVIDVSTPTITQTIASLPGARSEYHLNLASSPYTDLIVELSLTHTSLNVELGLIFTGSRIQYGISGYGRSDNFRDMSIVKVTAGGGIVTHNRDILRNINVPVKSTVAQRKSLEALLHDKQNQEMVFVSNFNVDDVTQYTRYGIASASKTSTQDLPDRRTYSLSITEAL